MDEGAQSKTVAELFLKQQAGNLGTNASRQRVVLGTSMLLNGGVGSRCP